jgi:hypothetical protein
MSKPQSNPIECPACGALFGYETAPGVLSMKYRDVYRTARGGTVEGPCRRCGAVVTWPVQKERVEK